MPNPGIQQHETLRPGQLVVATHSRQVEQALAAGRVLPVHQSRRPAPNQVSGMGIVVAQAALTTVQEL
ncbi:hypothetical protein D3C83_109040 [compost metagenome]